MKDIDNLLDKLEEDLEPVKPMASPVMRAVLSVGVAFLSVILIGAFVGFRMDLADKVYEFSFISEMIFIFAMACAGGYASALLALPDGDMNKHAVFAPYMAVIMALFILGQETYEHGFHLSHFEFHHCVMDAMIMGTVPVFMMIWMMKQGTPTRPFLAASVNAIAAGSIGYIGLRLTCASDELGHVCTYHIFPFVFVGLVLGLVARRLYRW